MKIKDILAIVAMALMTGGCNSSDDTQSDDGRVPIRLTASVESRLAVEACTRGTTTAATQDETLLEGQTVKAVITMEGTEYTRNYTVGTGDVLTTDETPKLYYPMNGSPVSIYAVHPSYTSGTDFTVAIDQRDDALYAASDLCYSKTTSYKKADWNKLTFEHLLSKVVVNITNSINSNAISSVQLNACIRTSLTYPVDNSGGYTLGDASIPNTVTLNPSAAAIIPPQTISEGTVLIDFTIPDVGFIEYTLPTDVTFESGHQYTYNITVSQTGIAVTSSITKWGGSETPLHTYVGNVTPTPYIYAYGEVGDLFYSDGSNSSTPDGAYSESRVPIGIIVYKNTANDAISDAITEKDTKQRGIGGHFLVMALKNSTLSYDQLRWMDPSDGSSLSTLYPSIFTQTGNTIDVLKSDYKGYEKTAKMLELGSEYKAASAAANFNAMPTGIVVPSITTGWFLPSTGQFYAMLNNVASVSTIGFLNNLSTPTVNNVCAAVNGLFTAKGLSTTEYDEFPLNAHYMCSSEYSSSEGTRIGFFQTVYFANVDKDYVLGDNYRVRPFLAY